MFLTLLSFDLFSNVGDEKVQGTDQGANGFVNSEKKTGVTW